MSNVNVRRLVDNIRSGTNVYTPLIEMIVNAIQAIDEANTSGGRIDIKVIRSRQDDMIDRLGDIDGFCLIDNGIGFTSTHRDAFDTLYTEHKIKDGGKGFGRFTCLKYFDNVDVVSHFQSGDKIIERSFQMGADKNIIVNEKIDDSKESKTGTQIRLTRIKSVKFPDRSLDVISRIVVERLLPYFVDAERPCPLIIISEADGEAHPLSLNSYLGQSSSQIVEMNVKESAFALNSDTVVYSFNVRVFKFYAPRAAKSKVSLVAHRREVTESFLQSYIPEFSEEFFEPDASGDPSKGRNFIIKAYVFGEYLNDNVSLERGEFRFQYDADMFSGISQEDIEVKATEIAKQAVGSDIIERKKRKESVIEEYVSLKAPWHRTLANEVDFSNLPMRPSNQEIELHLQKKKYEQEVKTRLQVADVLKSNSSAEISEKIAGLIESISETSKNDLIHYVSMRKCVLDLFGKSLELDENGKYKSEGDVHDIIMRRKKDSEALDYEAHNLWILDERLNFSAYISSDKPLNNARGDRTDITIYNRRVAFRGDNVFSNPITIFEFKKPQRDDFADPSSKEDPVQQIVRYVNQIRDGKFKAPKGRDILVNKGTPFYGYVVCDLTEKVKKWLQYEKEFTPMPDGLGWFRWFGNNNLYMEVNSWTKLMRDAEMRNRIFFKHLNIDLSDIE